MKELEELLEKALLVNTGLESPRWYVRKHEHNGVTRLSIEFFPKGIIHVTRQSKSFATNLINQEEIDEACRFIEDNLKS